MARRYNAKLQTNVCSGGTRYKFEKLRYTGRNGCHGVAFATISQILGTKLLIILIETFQRFIIRHPGKRQKGTI